MRQLEQREVILLAKNLAKDVFHPEMSMASHITETDSTGLAVGQRLDIRKDFPVKEPQEKTQDRGTSSTTNL